LVHDKRPDAVVRSTAPGLVTRASVRDGANAQTLHIKKIGNEFALAVFHP
jgi:hypothetical protein